jgi:ATP/maltotriose-dependent transcriptional regulator MalT
MTVAGTVARLAAVPNDPVIPSPSTPGRPVADNRPDGLINREVLITKLATIAAGRVAQVVAPAGAGKTILLRQHAARTGGVLASVGGEGTVAGFTSRVAAAVTGAHDGQTGSARRGVRWFCTSTTCTSSPARRPSPRSPT